MKRQNSMNVSTTDSKLLCYAQYTPPTRLICRVESRRRCERTRGQSWPSIQFPVLLSYWGWWQCGDLMTFLKKLSISITIHVVKRLWSLFGQFTVSKLSTECVGGRRKLAANSVHTADATKLDSWVASASAVCIGHNKERGLACHLGVSQRILNIHRCYY